MTFALRCAAFIVLGLSAVAADKPTKVEIGKRGKEARFKRTERGEIGVRSREIGGRHSA